jgi:CubicO group peptidase (beta-lactamase class C family)
VTAEQTAGGVPVFAAAGHLEPKGVALEKVIFEIGSISKVFTGILLAQAVIEKKVTLETTVGELMGRKASFADAKMAAVTLDQLATHTSGLPRIPENLAEGGDPADPYAHYDRKHLDAYVRGVKLAHAAPFPSSYSNLGVGLLGDLLARLYGKSWEELVVEKIAKPLGMPDTCVTLNAEQKRRLAPPYEGDKKASNWDFASLVGAGALLSTAEDMLKFAQALERPGASPLREAIEMTEQAHADDATTGLCLKITRLNGQKTYWFAGGTGGYRSWIMTTPATSKNVVILINNDALSPQDLVIGPGPKAASKKEAPSAPANADLAAYVGSYDTGIKNRDGVAIHYVFEARGADLWMQVTNQQFNKLSPVAESKDRFELKAVKAEIQFSREEGKVVSTTLYQAGLEIPAKRVPADGLTNY